jgi:asparagine N-glycosylation enzyme membrane subunit Stt3
VAGATITGDRKEIIVLSTLIVVLLVLWLLGFATSYTLGGLIHILLVVAIIAVLLRVIQGRNPLRG